MSAIKESLSAFWNDRSERQRNQIIAVAAVLLLGLIYTVLVAPALSGREQLEKILPPLRQQAAQLQGLAQEATGLASVVAQPIETMSRENIEAALARKGLKPQNVALTGELAKVQFNAISFAALLDWLDDLQKNARVTVVDANIAALTKTDSVNATLTLRQQKSE